MSLREQPSCTLCVTLRSVYILCRFADYLAQLFARAIWHNCPTGPDSIDRMRLTN